MDIFIHHQHPGRLGQAVFNTANPSTRPSWIMDCPKLWFCSGYPTTPVMAAGVADHVWTRTAQLAAIKLVVSTNMDN
jgi:hypothetical protein